MVSDSHRPAVLSIAAELWLDVDMWSVSIADVSLLPACVEKHYSRGKNGDDWIECPMIHYGRYRLFYDPGKHEIGVGFSG